MRRRVSLTFFIFSCTFPTAFLCQIREAARKLDCRGNQFKSGLEVKEKRRSVIQVTTGSTELNKVRLPPRAAAVVGAGPPSFTHRFESLRTPSALIEQDPRRRHRDRVHHRAVR